MKYLVAVTLLTFWNVGFANAIQSQTECACGSSTPPEDIFVAGNLTPLQSTCLNSEDEDQDDVRLVESDAQEK